MHVTFNPKDEDEVLNYRLPWSGTLADGDTVVASVWAAAGVTITAQSIEAGGLATLVRVAGGTNGETATLTNTVTTQGGETLEETVHLPIVASDLPELVGYQAPTPAHLMAKYPAFHDVAYSTIAAHLADAREGVDTSWSEARYAPALMALAAHTMALLGLGETDDVQAYARKGVSSIRDGAFSVSLSDRRVAEASGGGYDATPYGRAYKLLLRREKGGPRVIAPAVPPGGWGPVALQNNGGVLPWQGS